MSFKARPVYRGANTVAFVAHHLLQALTSLVKVFLSFPPPARFVALLSREVKGSSILLLADFLATVVVQSACTTGEFPVFGKLLFFVLLFGLVFYSTEAVIR